MNHRTKVAETRRAATRHKLLDAAMRLFSDQTGPTPVIDDVIREAKVSRGTFYNYFDSVDEVLAAISHELSDQMTTNILPVHDALLEPWQRLAVGFRLFMVRAMLDRKWAAFVTRVDAWQHNTLVAKHIGSDLEQGKARGQFSFDRIDVATDFITGASAYCIQTIRRGVPEPNLYMDAQVRMALTCVGCDREICERGVALSLSHLQSWAINEGLSAPAWAQYLNTDDGQRFLSHTPVSYK
ncbi:TetR/AcrR family transcriptional regulator [Paraburkholderia terrae]|uniref:TetR/AcrR family transcriptional regulator n=1 Tax=Paraburkholderia terrae TaxID=311230 RepID=A0A2I8EUG2_9BURK|nr:TetR/AcrR family transcriptional regulator [Paraburkholderia terrae]AUT63149.1 TetR/AcrR family transcriptional regulator [Paraburkholderia terrae]